MIFSFRLQVKVSEDGKESYAVMVTWPAKSLREKNHVVKEAPTVLGAIHGVVAELPSLFPDLPKKFWESMGRKTGPWGFWHATDWSSKFYEEGKPKDERAKS